MCGVVGAIGKESVSLDLFLSLLTLQHRGQDAAGIITSDGKELFIKKDTGLVQSVFSDKDISELKGNIGIGHTRYSTIGSATQENAQPMSVNATEKIAMAFNGNITNYSELKSGLLRNGVFLSTTADLEPVLQLFASKYEDTKDFFESAKFVVDKIEGAYSIVGLIAGNGLFAIRDTYGIRPLVLGKKGNNYMLASESVVLQTQRYSFVRDIAPGEAIFISDDGSIQHKVISMTGKAHCMFEWVYFARPESMIEERAVYKARLALGSLLAEKIKPMNLGIDVVIPVPDTARSCAIKLAEMLGVRHREGLIKNRYIGRTFIMPSQTKRNHNVNVKLNPIISIVKDKNVLVVDDSIVRGTTSKRIVSILREAGAKKVFFVSSCPPIKHPCYYGIDISTEDELIAGRKSIEEIREYIGADALIYATIDDLKKAIRRSICSACLDGNYPVKISENQKCFFCDDKKCR